MRVRIYLRERGADAETRQSVERAARREAAVLRRFQHPGVVRLKQYDGSGHTAGPALIFDYHPQTLKLDEYLVQFGGKLDILSRVALVRQLAETVRSAHSSQIHHRALAARSVHVIPRARGAEGRALGDEAAWLTPHLQISDWQIARHRPTGDSSSPAPGKTTRFAPTSMSLMHLAEGSDAYLAPELTARRADPVFMDVYGLGVLTYLLVTGAEPAASQAELVARLEAGEGLRPSALVDGLSEDIDELVQAATAYRPTQRLSSVDEFLDMLECVEDGLTSPSVDGAGIVETPGAAGSSAAEEKDPLDAVAGEVLDGRWEVRRRLATGSTSRAFLVRDLLVAAAAQNTQGSRKPRELAVLKVALTDARGEVLVREAEVMRRLRPDSRIIRLVEQEPFRIGIRMVLALEYVGDEREAIADPAEPGSKSRRREETVARQLREDGRLKVDQLEAYGDYLFGAVDFLEGEGVWHRDIKPDNIAIRVRPNRTRELVLLDFSLAGYPARQVDAGTDGYLDPFLGTLLRSSYDSHAERYAIAVTLHQMASGELPTWGDGSVAPRQTEPEQWPHPTIAADAFDPAIRDGLVGFFRKALHRDASRRHAELKPMRDAWRKIFLEASQTTTSSHRPSRHTAIETAASTQAPAAADEAADEVPNIADAEPESAEEQRNRLAAEATLTTHLSSAGLSPATESFLYGLGITTVGELLAYSQRTLINAPGLGAKTRKEVQDRQKEWGDRLRKAPLSPLDAHGRREAQAEIDDLSSAGPEPADGGTAELPARMLRTVSLDTLAALLVPELNNNGSNRSKVEMVRLLLRLPDDQGRLPEIGVWPKQKDVAEALNLSQGRIPQLLKEERKRWKKLPAVQALRAEIIDLMVGFGRVASAAEIADALVVRRGTRLHGHEQRRALALAAVRAIVEAEQLEPEESAFRHAVNRQAVGEGMGSGLLALEVGEDDGPDTPSAPGMLDYAQRLGKAADGLAKQETLPVATTVVTELSAVAPPLGVVEWSERRLVEVAAAASLNAAVTPRLEIYPRDLPLVRALRLTQAGLVRVFPDVPEGRQPGLTVETVHERVRARFPELVVRGQQGARGTTTHVLPADGPLTKALRDAGFELTLATREDTGTQRYLPTGMEHASSYFATRTSRRTAGSGWASRYDDDPRLAAAAATQERISASSRRDGFRVLTVRQGLSPAALRRLTGPSGLGGVGGVGGVGAEAASVTEFFLEAMHALITPGTKPTWDTILRADAAEAGSRGAVKFAEYARTAWGAVEVRLRERFASSGEASGRRAPLLLTDAAALARYDAMGVLDRLAQFSRQGGRGLWLLVPQEDPARPPKLGSVAVPYQAALGEWIELPDTWVRGANTPEATTAGASAMATATGSAANIGNGLGASA